MSIFLSSVLALFVLIYACMWIFMYVDESDMNGNGINEMEFDGYFRTTHGY